MHPDLKTRRRLFVLASQSYTTADRNWRAALVRTRQILPDSNRKCWPLGDPGSRMRRLYEERVHALERLQVAHLKLTVARDRLAERQPHPEISIH